jgi:hypothetical protein
MNRLAGGSKLSWVLDVSVRYEASCSRESNEMRSLL